MWGQRAERAPGDPSLVCEFQGWTGLAKVRMSDMNAKRRGMKKTARGC